MCCYFEKEYTVQCRVYFAPPQQRLGKARVVYRIRRELRLKTHGTAGLIYRPILSAAPGQPVGRIQLHTGRGGVHRHGDAAAVAPQHRRTAQTGPIHAEMVVIAVHQPQLLCRRIDVPADSLSCAEVKGRPRHRQRRPVGKQPGDVSRYVPAASASVCAIAVPPPFRLK